MMLKLDCHKRQQRSSLSVRYIPYMKLYVYRRTARYTTSFVCTRDKYKRRTHVEDNSRINSDIYQYLILFKGRTKHKNP